MEFEFAKNVKKQGKFQIVESFEIIIIVILKKLLLFYFHN
jgi:hypothetical protein